MIKFKDVKGNFQVSSIYYFFLGFCLMGRGIQYAVNSFFGSTIPMFFIVGVPLSIFAVLSIVGTNAFRINRGNFLILFFSFVAFGTSALFSGDFGSWLPFFKDFVQACLFLVLGSLFVIDFDRLLNTCKYYSLFSVVLYEYMIFSKSTGLKNYMGFGYNFLMIISFLMLYSAVYKKSILFVLTIFMSMQMLLYGPRMGWLLTAILYLIVVMIKVKKIWWKILLSLVSVVGAINYRALVLGVINLFINRTNTLTVTLYRLRQTLEGNSTSEELLGVRHILFSRSLELIKQYPLFGVGIGGFQKKAGIPFSYPHNIILEIFLDFGIVLGTVFIIFIVWLIVKSLIDAKEKKLESYLLLMIWLLLNFLRLFVSQSYVCENIFFAVICLAMNSLNNVNLTAGKRLRSVADAASDLKRENFSFRQEFTP